ncbi:MAG TPA: helix-turn-helix domain-containing protein [Rhodanobacteraceae bacterium]|nr:helix-turn-helix domain-containing protein [Rhodanobacteraceae bacterium]
MQRPGSLRQLGSTQQKLLRKLLLSPQGATVEELCRAIGVTHNAVRQHLAVLMGAGFVERGESIRSGGRPRACYVLQPAGRELFPRNYALMARGMIEYLYAHAGTQAVQHMLSEMGARLGADATARIATASDGQEATRLLAEQLDTLGYEAQVVEADGHTEVEAWNCVFHSLARSHPDVCRFDLAFMGAATGRPVQRTQCMLHGAPACRFRIGSTAKGLTSIEAAVLKSREKGGNGRFDSDHEEQASA